MIQLGNQFEREGANEWGQGKCTMIVVFEASTHDTRSFSKKTIKPAKAMLQCTNARKNRKQWKK